MVIALSSTKPYRFASLVGEGASGHGQAGNCGTQKSHMYFCI